MKINLINTAQWQAFVASPELLIDRIEREVFIVRNFMDEKRVDDFKHFCIGLSRETPASWHPCLDGCPDYHRIHHQYPQAFVRSTQHGYYFHPWNDNFATFAEFPGFEEIFELKARAAGSSFAAYRSNVPSAGPIARIVCHQYPPGGGGQEEHIDPVSPFAKVQTIIQASTPGEDYRKGGLYINDPEYGIVNIDPLTKKGDLILASPGVKHGVASIDDDEALQWETDRGRWIIMPIIIHSDHVKDISVKPSRTQTS
ncbi:hypothetical protein FOB72_11315 [Cupriavidus pauculus]|jgi:hypothetical protein|uniref:Fe2OG dioxygenase domain-containing protein n=1 Tax=Cupriavidus pauculus TaxID=82633 RepID=A0A5P2H3W7_9BURK|nr:hypothetical protein [Cupriavidus pauculus]QET02566.1 hypothetical protein FOB72_11315 [Cupriavidus pauculus]